MCRQLYRGQHAAAARGNDAACRESRASARAAVGRARLIARGSDNVLKITSDLAT